MKYCKKCVQPDSRPGIVFSEDGICGACLWEEEKKKINWEERKAELFEIVESAKSKGKIYDCVIGVSGGKDSLFQALYARDVLKLKTLLVNCEPDHITELGAYNIENIKQLGFDVIAVRPNPVIQRKLIKRDFYKYLNPIKPTEYVLWASAYIIADKFDIPLVIQGENPGETLGVSKTTGTDGNALNADLQNTIKVDPLDEYLSDEILKDDLFLYRYDKQKMIEKGIKGIWLSHYVKEWSQPHNAAFSMKHGLKIRPNTVNLYDLGTYRRYSQLDGAMLEVNQLFKYIKFGFGQATDHVCYDIREGLISRDEGIFLIKELDGKCGNQFILDFCNYIQITLEEFWNHANKFRGVMWKQNHLGEWVLDNPIWEIFPIQGNHSLQVICERLDEDLENIVI